MQVYQGGRLVRRRALRAGKRKLLSLCYFHINFPGSQQELQRKRLEFVVIRGNVVLLRRTNGLGTSQKVTVPENIKGLAVYRAG
ncbi:hypothetical protein FQA47_011523 [Oryzias melastigma]|uniref:Uncharacterized protein n=1 Tax=Oryzias melastigma TaxID=30732 RepID=A0A834C472_ORYME|nr:hypothetical protein FQA47_011523 [Oryzias melastigma]